MPPAPQPRDTSTKHFLAEFSKTNTFREYRNIVDTIQATGDVSSEAQEALAKGRKKLEAAFEEFVLKDRNIKAVIQMRTEKLTEDNKKLSLTDRIAISSARTIPLSYENPEASAKQDTLAPYLEALKKSLDDMGKKQNESGKSTSLLQQSKLSAALADARAEGILYQADEAHSCEESVMSTLPHNTKNTSSRFQV